MAIPNTLGQKDGSQTIRAFIGNFVKDDFFIEILKIALYPSEFHEVSLSTSSSTIDFIRKFFNDILKTCYQLQITNSKQIKKYIDVSSTILNIRESKSVIIDYDNVYQHIGNVDVVQQKIINDASKHRIKDVDIFRKKIDNIIKTINVYYEVCSISSSIIMFDNLSDYANKPNVSVFEIAKLFKDNVIMMYNDLSKLQSLSKLENETDYFIINRPESNKALAENIVNYISQGYSFLKTGYDIFDNTIDGFESSSVHLFAAPSNHGKSLMMVNLVNTIVKANINDFDDGDTILYVTLEDKQSCPALW